MRAAVTRAEIKRTIFSMNRNKAPGPDGYSTGFFHKAWPIVENGVAEAILEFFVTGNLLREVNSTIINLVPKKKNPTSMSKYRPISCCNLIYKCITKILANRLLPGLDEVISLNQGAFIPKRSIAENILLAQELVCDYHKDKGKPQCTLKVDLMKAYDSVSWEFVLHCLSCFGAPSQFVKWIKACICSPSYSIALNGTLVGYFHGKKGLRQGDPISPYLFVLAMEVLSRLLADIPQAHPSFGFHPRCQPLLINHLCFADDLLIFAAADLNSLSIIKSVLEEFEDISGLKANPAKSSLFCAGVNNEDKKELLELMHMNEGNFPFRYQTFDGC